MIRETKPDHIIVTTVDSTHDQYIIRGMELGCDIITEKPLTMDEVKDPYQQAAKVRDGVLAVLVGVAARKSAESGKPVRISELTDIPLKAQRPHT